MAIVDPPLALPPDEDLSPAQTEAADRIRSGPRGALFGPFVPLLHSPVLMTRLQLVGEYLRFESSLPGDVFELVVLTVARHWDQQFEWVYHHPLALRAGVPESVIEDIEASRKPSDGRPELSTAWDAVRSLLETGSIPEQAFSRLEPLGTAAIVDLIAAVGYYTTLAFTMNVARTPPPEGTVTLKERVR